MANSSSGHKRVPRVYLISALDKAGKNQLCTIWEVPEFPQPVSHSGCPLLAGLASNLLQELRRRGSSVHLVHLQHKASLATS